jgi:uncharacterized protein
MSQKSESRIKLRKDKSEAGNGAIRFEWDPKKAKKKHDVSFDEAATVFYDPLSATFYDPDHSADEQRYIIIGFSSQSCLLVVAYLEKEENIRIISERIATMHERKKHER